jgi:uncharacterized protein involved in response to NO
MTSTPTPSTDPYQWFFPIGLILGCLGTGIWIVNWMPGLPWYPGIAHTDLMMGGFFLTMAAGFLMTAIPKFTGTAGAHFWEKMGVALPAGGALAFAYAQNRLFFHTAIFIMTLMLLIFALRRSRLVFLGFGIVSAVLSTFVMMLQDMHPLPTSILILGRQLYYYGTSFFLIVGVGLRIFPMLTGMRPSDPPWRILGWPRAGTMLAIMVWVSCWMVILGLVIRVTVPGYAIHGAHIYYIGGVSVMIFAVATRVSLAHGGHGLAMERRSGFLIAILTLLGIALLVRVSAPWFPNVYNSHLAYAAMAWVLAAVCWGIRLIPKLWCRKSGG